MQISKGGPQKNGEEEYFTEKVHLITQVFVLGVSVFPWAQQAGCGSC